MADTTSAVDSIRTVYSLLGIFALVAITAIVMASLAFSQMNLRNSRRDALFYLINQNPPNGSGVVLFSEEVNVLINPGQTSNILTFNMAPNGYNPSDGRLNLNLVTSFTRADVNNTSENAFGTLMLGNMTSTFQIHPGATSVDGVVTFSATTLYGGGPYTVSATNTGNVAYVATMVRITTIPRASNMPTSTSTRKKSRKVRFMGI